MKNNDTFTIRPLDFRQVGENQWQAKTSDGTLYAVELMHGVWRWSASFRPYRPMPWTSAPTKEAAMAACEQHWRSEIEPALVRVEDGRDALLGRALEAMRAASGYIRHDKMCDSQDRESLENCDCGLWAVWGAVRSLIAEIEKALPAVKPEPQST